MEVSAENSDEGGLQLTVDIEIGLHPACHIDAEHLVEKSTEYAFKVAEEKLKVAKIEEHID